MAVFSANQVRHFYVAKKLADAKVTNTNTAGDIRPVEADGNLYFEYKGADSLMRTDLIKISNIMYAKVIDADDASQVMKAKVAKIALDTEVNEGKLVSGQDYVLRVAFRQYIGMSDEDIYYKHAVVHAYAGMTAPQFYEKLAVSLWQNFSRELVPLIKIGIAGKEVAGTKVVNGVTKCIDATGAVIVTDAATEVTLTEAPQEWVLGIKPLVPVYFDVYPSTIVADGEERIWGKITNTVSATDVTYNGRVVADMEYFYMGERGDQYRMVNWPNYIPTKYMVDPDTKYNIIEIHYAFTDSNESVQKSEKDITIVVPKVGANNAAANKLANDIIGAINTATGLNIATLATA